MSVPVAEASEESGKQRQKFQGQDTLSGVWLCTFVNASSKSTLIVASIHDHSSGGLQAFIQYIPHNPAMMLHCDS